MLLSVITPTHRAAHIGDAYRSLRAQTYQNWEWVVVPNRGVDLSSLPDDARIRVIRVDGVDAMGIGALKALACAHSRGDLFVELDHDDKLATNALASLHRAAAVDAYENRCFFYSDFVRFSAAGPVAPYAASNGWERYSVAVDGETVVAERAFASTAASLSAVSWAPNHVRAWSRSAYEAVGGHDPALTICDDYDLVCRTYVAGFAFKHIPEPLYFYRETTAADGGDNSYREHADALWTTHAAVRRRHFADVCKMWCDRAGLRIHAHERNATFPGVTDKIGVALIDARDIPVYGDAAVAFWARVYRATAPGGIVKLTLRDMVDDPRDGPPWPRGAERWLYDPAKRNATPMPPIRFNRLYEEDGVVELVSWKGERLPGPTLWR